MATPGAPLFARRLPALAAGLTAGLATGLVLAAGTPAATAGGGVLAALDPDLHLPFDGLDSAGAPVLDSLGSAEVVTRVSAAAGGEILAGPGRSGDGHSLRFPRFRPDEAASPAVVVVEPAAGAADGTEPGDGDFAFGADFALHAATGVSSTDNGDNLVQRGLFGPGSQYKLQVDAGRPSCRVAGSDGAVLVRAAEEVESGRWYRVRCRRVGTQVTLRVISWSGIGRDVREYVAQGPTGTLSYGAGDSPFSIGGKVDEDGRVLVGDSDQFNGLVDDVLYRNLG